MVIGVAINGSEKSEIFGTNIENGNLTRFHKRGMFCSKLLLMALEGSAEWYSELAITTRISTSLPLMI